MTKATGNATDASTAALQGNASHLVFVDALLVALIVASVIGLARVPWVARWWTAINRGLLVPAAEPAHFPQFVSSCCVGCRCYCGELLCRMLTRMGMIWVAVCRIAAASVHRVMLLSPESWDSVAVLGWSAWQLLLVPARRLSA